MIDRSSASDSQVPDALTQVNPPDLIEVLPPAPWVSRRSLPIWLKAAERRRNRQALWLRSCPATSDRNLATVGARSHTARTIIVNPMKRRLRDAFLGGYCTDSEDCLFDTYERFL